MAQEVIEITEREIEIIEVIERGPVGQTGPQPDINYTVVSSARTLEAADLIAADTSGGAFTLTLPANPSNGDAVDIFDFSETFDTNPLTIARNGSRIESLEENLVCNVEGAYFTLIYTGATRGWQVLPRYGTSGGGGESALTTQGDMLYRGASTGERLPIGTTGQILRVSASGIPEWGAAPASGVSSVSGKTGAVLLDSTDIFTEQALQISDAGTADCNGVFVYGGLFNGRPTYYATKDTFVYWDGSNWVINHNGDDQYFGTATTYAWQAVWSLGDGANPLPVVAQAASHEFEQVVGQRTNPTSRGDAASKNVGTGANDVASGNHTHSAATQSVAGFLSASDKTKIDGIAASTATPSALGTAAAGTSSNFARADHVHAMPNASALLSTGAGEGDLPVAQGDGTISWQNGTTWAGINITAADVGAATASHAASHAAAGSDPVTPASIGAQSIFVTEDLGTITANVTLTAARAKIYTVTVNTFDTPAPYVDLPNTSILAGDVVQIRFTSFTGRTLQLRRAGNPFSTMYSGQQATFIAASTSSSSWQESPNNRISVGTGSGVPIITGADAYITAGAFGTSAGQFAEGNHTHGNLTNDGKVGSTSGLPLVTTTAGAVTTLALGTAGQVLTVNSGANGVEFAAAAGGGFGEVRFDTATVYTYTGQAAAGASESSAVWFIRRSEYSTAGAYVSTTTANNVQWANRLTATYT